MEAVQRLTERRLVTALAALLMACVLGVLANAPSALAKNAPSAPATCANPVACENQLPGDPPSDWQVQGVGDPSIQGYATSMSVNVGQTVYFKIKTPSTAFHFDILRLGYYQGNGARKIASNLKPSATLPQSQPDCLTDSSTGLIDCGNWAVSASWTVPSNAVSGVYIAHLVRDDSQDPGGSSQIIFVVRNDSSRSNILLSTSDSTWEAYNDYGGNSLYSCTVACPANSNPIAYNAAYAVSYNRPFDGSLVTDNGFSYIYYVEYQMIRFLERNGYDVSYTTSSDVDRAGSLLLNHKIFMSNGHDEYWSGAQRTNVTTAREHGVNLAFFSGNELFWKTRWAASEDGSNTPYRTLVTYKETQQRNPPLDPQYPVWTGTWRDPRFSPPADGGLPENALSGQYFLVDSGTADITVPYQYAKERIWRNTAVTKLTAGQSLTLGASIGTLGYEWDLDVDNGFRPAGLFDLSSTTVSNAPAVFTDYGALTARATETHHLTEYRAPSGALVFATGTVQWAWGLDNTNAWAEGSTDPSGLPPDPNMQQATVNVLADMGAQPTTLMTGLKATAASTETTAPVSTINSPSGGANIQDGTSVTVSGSAKDTDGGGVAGVEVSTDGGAHWHPATLTTPDGPNVNWSYNWIAHGYPSTTIRSRGVDDSGNLETPSRGISVNIKCPCSLWGTNVTPTTPDFGDGTSVEVGVKFKTDTFGTVSGIQFYKASTNTGTHIGDLWDANGNLLARATFTTETASGWQQVTFSNPVPIMPNTTYVASYFAPVGHYAATSGYFYPPPSPPPTGGGSIDSPPLHAIPNATSADGVYAYSTTSTFPASSYNATNYWVDVMFAPAPAPGQATNVSATPGYNSATVSWAAPSTGGPVTKYTVTPYIGSTAQTATTVTGNPPATSVTIGGLMPSTTYTFTVQASNPNGSGPISSNSNSVVPIAPTAPSAPTGVSASPATGRAFVAWTAPSSNGSAITSYTITPYVGSAAQTPVQVGDPSATSATVTGLTNGTTYTFTVSATNGVGTGSASAASNAVAPQDTIFDLATPATIDSGDGSSAEVGVKFTADTSGSITGIRFYKAPGNTGTHIGSLWDARGNLLAQATFANETASGWQAVTFSSPTAVTAGNTYVAGYFAPSGHYSASTAGLNSAYDNPPLHAVANGTSANGVFAYSNSSTFPTSSFNATNYWVDVLFAPAPPPGQVTNVSANPGYSSATVSWSAPSSGGPVTAYTVTPYIGSTAQTPITVSGNPPATNTTIQGLTPGAAYSFTVQAVDGNQTGPVSDPSNSVTPLAPSAPSAPANVTASPASGQAQVSWTQPSSNGSAITAYTITPYIGSAAQAPVQVTDPAATSAIVSGLTNGTSYTFTVSASNGLGAGPESAPSSAVTPEDTIFDFATPLTIDSGDSSGIEVGVKFTADMNGSIVGIRFFKSAANTGTHVGNLWDTNGNLLSTGTFTNETASGWQYMTFANPVPITTGTTYVASYYAPNGHYSATTQGLSSPFDNPPLHAVGDSASADGVYAYGATSSFPTSSFNSTNYWVDVLFSTP
jgi:hypothetical protein